MMPVVIRPAAPAFDSSGTPFSQEFADVYHSAASGPGQSRHVFLRGNDLPARWARRRSSPSSKQVSASDLTSWRRGLHGGEIASDAAGRNKWRLRKNPLRLKESFSLHGAT